MKQNTKPLNEEVFGVAPMQQKNNSVAETKESETQTPGGVNKLHNRVTQTRVEERLWEKEFDKEICKEYLEYGYKAYVSLVKDFITKALSQRELEVLENLKPKNIKADYYQVNYFKDNRTVFQTPVNNLIKNE